MKELIVERRHALCYNSATQLADDFLSHPPAAGCHYFPQACGHLTQPKNVTVLDQYQVILLDDRGTYV